MDFPPHKGDRKPIQTDSDIEYQDTQRKRERREQDESLYQSENRKPCRGRD